MGAGSHTPTARVHLGHLRGGLGLRRARPGMAPAFSPGGPEGILPDGPLLGGRIGGMGHEPGGAKGAGGWGPKTQRQARKPPHRGRSTTPRPPYVHGPSPMLPPPATGACADMTRMATPQMLTQHHC